MLTMKNGLITQLPVRAKPRLFRRTRIVIVGCGDVGLRILGENHRKAHGIRWIGTARRAEQCNTIRNSGALALEGNLSEPTFIKRISTLAHRWLVLVPPPPSGQTDAISRLLSLCLKARATAQADQQRQMRIDYVSTTGVYGDAKGQWVDETSPRKASSARAVRRVHAENIWIKSGKQSDLSVRIHRAPGIYAFERLPIARLQQGTPAILASEDSYSNHIHADDLARWVLWAQFKGPAGRAYNIVDDHPGKMGDYFDLVAEKSGLAKPPRLSRAAIQAAVSPMLWSFMNESRRISNKRLGELGFHLRFESVFAFLSDPKISSRLRSISD